MPIYAYRCQSCAHEQDILQKMSDAVLNVCPKCQQDTFVKQVTAAGFALKGNGYYATDFKNNACPAVQNALNNDSPPPTCAGNCTKH